MSIENTLASIDNSLKTIVTLLQAGATPAPADTPAPEKKTRAKKAEAPAAPAVTAEPEVPAAPAVPVQSPIGLVAGDPEGTVYWISEELRTVYAQTPGNPVPQPASFKAATADEYLAKKEEFAKKAVTTEPSVAAQPDTASASAPEWKEVLSAIQEINRSSKPGHGRDGVMAVLKHFGLEGKKVPALEELNKHAEILAFAKNLLTGSDDDLGL